MRQYMTISGESYAVKSDRQRHRVYAWENEIVRPKDTTLISVEAAQSVVNYIWESEGREYPPQVELKHGKRPRCADATRFKLRFPENMLYTWIIIHELAHTFTSNEDGASNGHGDWFMQVYTRLLSKYVNIPLPLLYYTANEKGIKIKGLTKS